MRFVTKHTHGIHNVHGAFQMPVFLPVQLASAEQIDAAYLELARGQRALIAVNAELRQRIGPRLGADYRCV